MAAATIREKLYWQQKELVKHLIRKELGKHEETLTREIREAKDSGVKMWIMINKLKGMEREERETPWGWGGCSDRGN